jgi:hypothetical protein
MGHCAQCGHEHGWLTRLRIQIGKDKLRPCEHCGTETVNKDRLFVHSILSIFVYAALLGIPMTGLHQITEGMIKLGVPLLFFVVAIPLRKPES